MLVQYISNLSNSFSGNNFILIISKVNDIKKIKMIGNDENENNQN